MSHDFSVMEIQLSVDARRHFPFAFQLSHDFSVMEILVVIAAVLSVFGFQLSHDFSVMEMIWELGDK